MGEIARITTKKPEAKSEKSVFKMRQNELSQSINSPVEQILYLQSTIGNEAVQRLIKSGDLQAKLKIGQPGDKYEQEADRVADAVMRMPEPKVHRQVEPEEEEEETLQSKPLAGQITPLVQVQRQEEPEEEEEEMLQAKPLAEEITPFVQRQVEPEEEEEEEELQTKATSGHLSEVNSNLESHILSLKGGGQPLPESALAYFEPRFGHDFNQVRVHTNTQAVESARLVNAQAYTIENNIVFGEGQYNPKINSGKRLLAHELTHVVQQSGVNKSIAFNLNLFNKRDKGINIHEKISNATIQRSWTLTTRSSPGTNCLAFALGLSSTWFPPNPSHPFNERPVLAQKMTSHGYSKTQDGTFSSGNDKVMLIYDVGWRARNPGEVGPPLPGGGFAPLANIWKHAIVQRGSGTGNWESQNGIGGAIYDNIDTPIQFVNNFYPPVSVGSQPGGVSLPPSLLSRIVSWTNSFEYWIK